MVDWWQALLLVLVGGLAGLPTAYAVHRWTTQASRRVAEQQAIRQHRRERVQPILDFLDTAKQFAAVQDMMHSIDLQLKSLGPQDRAAAEQWEKMKSGLSDGIPDWIHETRAFSVANMAAISVPGLQRELFNIYTALMMRGDPRMLHRFGPGLRSAEQLVERYVAGAVPPEPTPRGPGQET